MSRSLWSLLSAKSRRFVLKKTKTWKEKMGGEASV